MLGAAGGSALLAYWMRSAVARAEGEPGPKRLVIIHRPNGTIAEDWVRGGARGPILEPFAPVWDRAVVLKGIDVRPSNGTTGGSHEAGLVTIMTGGALGATYRTNDDFRSTAPSLDQRLAKQSPLLKGRPIESLQLGSHGAQDGGNEIPNTTLSYRGAADPMYPELDPSKVLSRISALIMPGGANPNNDAAIARARARRKSVLDFVRGDLNRVRSAFPASMKADLDVQEAAIRELEQGLGGGMMPGAVSACTAPSALSGAKAGGNYQNTEKVAADHFKLIVAAFVCDLTRVVTFQWATGASLLAFGDLGTNNHHSTSHANQRGVLSSVDRWYSEKTSAFIQQLANTADVGGGKLLDNTLVWYINEISEGWSHSFNDFPFVLFGGDGVGLKDRGRILNVSGQGKTSNDVWTSFAPVFQTTLGGYATKASGPIAGLFAV
jgi:hypothetical protein